MNQKDFNQLKKDYSYMFEHADSREPISMFGIECDSGWDEIIKNTCKSISEIDKLKEVRISQVKEKFATLTIHAHVESDDQDLQRKVWDIIGESEKLTRKTCEYCGNVGEQATTGFWIKTLCDDCVDVSKNTDRPFKRFENK